MHSQTQPIFATVSLQSCQQLHVSASILVIYRLYSFFLFIRLTILNTMCVLFDKISFTFRTVSISTSKLANMRCVWLYFRHILIWSTQSWCLISKLAQLGKANISVVSGWLQHTVVSAWQEETDRNVTSAPREVSWSYSVCRGLPAVL